MRYTELNVFGVFVSPISAMMLAAYVIYVVLWRVADRLGLWRHLWHPALASVALYIILLSAIVIGVGR
jgi:predicted PurR-regulated permease PerM